MFHYTNSIVNKQGDVLPGYFVQVVNPTTGLVVPIYADKGGTPIITVSGVANMALVDANGMVSLYVVDGNYNVNLYAQDATTLKGSYLDVPMVGAITLQIGTVSMLSAGAAPTASIDSTTTPAKLNLGLPTTTGAAGPAGPAGPAGNASGITQVASLAALRLVTGQATGEPRYLTAPGLEGTFIYKLGDYSARVTADTRGGIFVAASGIATTTGAWVRQYDGFTNIRWWGTAGDDTTDDLPAFNGALATLKAMTNLTTAGANGVSAPGLYIPTPPKAYYLSNTLNIFHQVHIKGDGGGQIGSLLRFNINVNGVVFNEYRTNNDAGNASTATGLGDAAHSVMEDICLRGGGTPGYLGPPYQNAANNTGWGVRIRTNPVRCTRVRVEFWGSGGFNINSTAGSTGFTAGNANQFNLDQCEAWYNIGPGFFVAGNDSNAGKVSNCNATSNGGAGFGDISFLGNTYDSCHARDNGNLDPNTNNSPVGCCNYAGNKYYVVVGQEAAASTTVPGTNSAVWVLNNNIGANVTWVSGKTWVCGAPYYTNPTNTNARNVFTGCYSESSQAPIMVYAPSLWIGGLTEDSVGVDSNSTATVLSSSTPNGGGLKSTKGFAVLSGSYGINFGQYGNGLNVYNHIIGSNNYSIGVSGTVVQRLEQGAQVTEQWGMSTDASNLGPYHHYIRRLFVQNVTPAYNNINASSQLGYANALADLNGLVVTQGSRFYYANATSGQREGLYVTVGGTVGTNATLVEFGKVGPNVGYIAGDGGAVTQATSKATGVTLNKLCGQITLNNASLAANTAVSFVLTNSNIAATDVMRVNVASGAATPGSYLVQAEAFGAGSVTISVRNMTAGALGEALVLNFVVIKSVAA